MYLIIVLLCFKFKSNKNQCEDVFYEKRHNLQSKEPSIGRN